MANKKEAKATVKAGTETTNSSVATVGIDGKLALGVGVDVDMSVSVDTKPAQKAVTDTAIAVGKGTEEVAGHVADTANDAGKAIGGAAKDAVQKVKKLKLW